MFKKLMVLLTLGFAAVTTSACGVHAGGHVGGAHAGGGAGIH